MQTNVRNFIDSIHTFVSAQPMRAILGWRAPSYNGGNVVDLDERIRRDNDAVEAKDCRSVDEVSSGGAGTIEH